MKRIDKLFDEYCYRFSSFISKCPNNTNVSKGRHHYIKYHQSTKYLLLPIEETKDEARVMLDTSSPSDTWMDIRLAQDKIDYYVPFELGNGTRATVKILNLKHDAICYKPGMLKLIERMEHGKHRFLSPFLPSYAFIWLDERP